MVRLGQSCSRSEQGATVPLGSVQTRALATEDTATLRAGFNGISFQTNLKMLTRKYWDPFYSSRLVFFRSLPLECQRERSVGRIGIRHRLYIHTRLISHLPPTGTHAPSGQHAQAVSSSRQTRLHYNKQSRPVDFGTTPTNRRDLFLQQRTASGSFRTPFGWRCCQKPPRCPVSSNIHIHTNSPHGRHAAEQGLGLGFDISTS